MAARKQTRGKRTGGRSVVRAAGAAKKVTRKAGAKKTARKTTRRSVRRMPKKVRVNAKTAKKAGRAAAKRRDSVLHREVFTIGPRGGTVRGGLRDVSKRQREMLRTCTTTLSRVTAACAPRSAFGTLGLFLLGVMTGVALLITFMYVSKNEVLLRFLIDENVSVLDGIPVQIENEVDYSFASDPSFLDPPADLNGVDLSEFWEVWRLIENDFVAKPERRVAGDADAGDGAGDDAGAGDDERADGDDAAGVVGVGPTREELVRGAIDGLTRATDDQYTNFFEPRDAKEFEEEVLNGEIDGIGAYISFESGELEIVSVIEKGPAFYSGLKDGDIIRMIDGVSSSRYNLTEAAYAIRGPRGSSVELVVYRPSEKNEFRVTIIRGRIEIPTVEYEVTDGVFVIRLMTFTKHTPDAFRDALREFVRVANAGGPDRILLDMRGNVGGVMSVAVDIAGLFLPAESIVLYEYRGDENLRAFRTTRPAFRNNVLPVMTVLVDGGSASSSEIVAAALRYYGAADIVGTPTLGKGSVQALKEIGDRQSLLKLTVAHWLTPAKESVEREGIQPDVDYADSAEKLLEEDSDFDAEAYMLDRAAAHLRGK